MRKGTGLIGGIILILILCLPVFAGSPVSITIGQEATIDADQILLANIANLQGDDLDSSGLTKIDLGEAPAAGQSRILTKQYIVFKLAQAGFKPEDYILTMPDQIRVTSAGMKLTGEALQNLIQKSLATEVPTVWSSWHADFIGKFNERWVKPGELGVQIAHTDPLKPGSNLLRITVISNGSPVLRLSVAVQITATGRAPVLTENVERHALLTEASLKWEERTLNGREYMDATTGKIRATHRLRQGDVVCQNDLEEAPLVKKGEKVRMVFQSGGASVETYGLAQMEGWMGQAVNVENVDSKKVILAVVVGEGSVEVQ